MASYKYIQKTFQEEYKTRTPEYKKRIASWRKESPLLRTEKPTNIAAARTKGYKAKKGYVVVRVRIIRGRRKREKPAGGRKPSKAGRFFSRAKSLQQIAEERAGRKFRNLEVLNSYWIGEDGEYKFFEVILIDKALVPEWRKLQKGRIFRGLTRSGRKERGLYT